MIIYVSSRITWTSPPIFSSVKGLDELTPALLINKESGLSPICLTNSLILLTLRQSSAGPISTLEFGHVAVISFFTELADSKFLQAKMTWYPSSASDFAASLCF